jgi:Putative MetA-pathway of phenol degradation
MLVVLGAQAQEGELRLGGGFHYSTGDYGSSIDTRITTLEATARYETGSMVYRASVPWLTVKGDTGVIPGIGQASSAPVRSGSASGLGDIVLSAAYSAYYNSATTLGVDLTGKVKLPTADESEGLGTGEPDFAFLVDLYRSFDRVTGFGGIGYHIMGDSAQFPLENAWSANLGATYRLDARESVGAMLEGRQRVAPGGSRTRELTGFWMRRLEAQWRAQLYGLIGLAEGSPDWGFGLSLARPL